MLTALPRVKDRGVIQVTDGGTVQSEPGAYMV